MVQKIAKDTTLAEVLDYNPPTAREIEKILAKHNLPCLHCPMAKFEIENLTLGQVCKMYEIDLENLLKELNEKLKQ